MADLFAPTKLSVSLPTCLTPSPCLTPCFHASLLHFLSPCLTPRFPASLPYLLLHYLTPCFFASLPASLPHSLPVSLALCLSASLLSCVLVPLPYCLSDFLSHKVGQVRLIHTRPLVIKLIPHDHMPVVIRGQDRLFAESNGRCSIAGRRGREGRN